MKPKPNFTGIDLQYNGLFRKKISVAKFIDSGLLEKRRGGEKNELKSLTSAERKSGLSQNE